MKKTHFKIFPEIPVLEGIDIICGKANIKSKSRLDIGVIIFHDLANVAYVTTKSKTFAANIKWLKENKNILAIVSNAGYGLFDNIENISDDILQKFFNVNLISHVLLAKKIIPYFKAKNQGTLIFLGSEAAVKAGKKGSIYSAAKGAIRNLSISLREECSSAGIKVSLINPGMVRTPFFDSLNFKPGRKSDNAIDSQDIAEIVSLILRSGNSIVFDEINISPLKKVIEFK